MNRKYKNSSKKQDPKVSPAPAALQDTAGRYHTVKMQLGGGADEVKRMIDRQLRIHEEDGFELHTILHVNSVEAIAIFNKI